MNSKRKLISRIGMVSKGTVYALIGVLTSISSFGYGGKESGSKGVLRYLAEQSYGKIVLIIIGLGLAAYVFYRLYQSFGPGPDKADDSKEYIKRVAYFISALLYGVLAYLAIRLALGGGSKHHDSLSGNQGYSDILLIAIGIGIAVKAIYDIYRAYSKKFREDIQETEMGRKEKMWLLNSGRFGHTARGLVLGLMSFITLKSGLSNGSKIGRQTDAFDYIKEEFGTIALGCIAIGFIAYGFYMFIKAKYPAMDFK